MKLRGGGFFDFFLSFYEMSVGIEYGQPFSELTSIFAEYVNLLLTQKSKNNQEKKWITRRCIFVFNYSVTDHSSSAILLELETTWIIDFAALSEGNCPEN